MLVLALSIILVLAGCGGGGGSSPVQINSFYDAYQIGTEWTYRETDPNAYVFTYTERVVGTKSINGVDCLDIERTYSNYGTSFHYYTTASDREGVLLYDDSDISTSPGPNMSYPPFPFRDFSYTRTYDGGSITYDIRIISACTTIDTVSGHYDNAVKLEYHTSSPGYAGNYVWLVPGVGMVKRQVVQKSTGNIRTIELESFVPKVGSGSASIIID